MSQTRAVWILNCSAIVEYIDSILIDLVDFYPWLGDGTKVDKTWNWRNFQEGRKSQKDQFIDWVICTWLCEYYYMDIVNKDDFYDLEWAEVYNNHIGTGTIVEELVMKALPVPIPSSEQPLKYVVRRSCGSLFIEFQCEPGTRFHFVNQPWY
jgi:hypothetical protein